MSVAAYIVELVVTGLTCLVAAWLSSDLLGRPTKDIFWFYIGLLLVLGRVLQEAGVTL